MKKFLLGVLFSIPFATYASVCPSPEVINANIKEVGRRLHIYFTNQDGNWLDVNGELLNPGDKITAFKRVKLIKLPSNSVEVQCEYTVYKIQQYTFEVQVTLANPGQYVGTTPYWVAEGQVCEQNSIDNCAFKLNT